MQSETTDASAAAKSGLFVLCLRFMSILMVPVGLVLALPTTAIADELTIADITLRADDPVVVGRGRALYVEHCASCHGAELEGQPDWRRRLENDRLPAPPHDETGHTWHHPDGLLFDLVKRGISAVVGGGYESDMPAYENVLSDDEIVAVLSYIKSRWPENIRLRHDEMSDIYRKQSRK